MLGLKPTRAQLVGVKDRLGLGITELGIISNHSFLESSLPYISMFVHDKENTESQPLFFLLEATQVNNLDRQHVDSFMGKVD